MLTCEWWIDNATGHQPCDTAQTAPAVGNYNIMVMAKSRQNTTATSSQPLRVKNIDPPTVSACTPPAGVGAHENATLSATASGTVSSWHWKISRGNPPQDTGITGDTAGSFSFVPAVADTFEAEVWVSNTGGDSAHQNCTFTVVDRTAPDSHKIDQVDDVFVKTEGIDTIIRDPAKRITLTATDPESPINHSALTVYYTIGNPCTGTTSAPQSQTQTSDSGSASTLIDLGTCGPPQGPFHLATPMTLSVNRITSSATSGGGTNSWID